MFHRMSVLVSSIFMSLLSSKRVDAFVQLRPALVATHQSKTIMCASSQRRAFLSEVVSGTCFGIIATSAVGERAFAGYQQEYLKEPTAEFKAIEARQSEFAAAQRVYKQEFVKSLDAFLAATSDEDAIKYLNVMSTTVAQRGGLPESIRINDLLRTCRRKKAEMKEGGKWGTPVQIAYETLVQTTNKTVVPLQSGS